MAKLPYEPEPLEALRARYAAALEPLYDQLSVASERQPVPSGLRPHVLDGEDGLRLMVSREQTPDGRIVIHLSASIHPASALYWNVRAGIVSPQDFLDSVVARWRVLSDSTARARLIGISQKGCPHWFAGV
jgi:hypothetical protein